LNHLDSPLCIAIRYLSLSERVVALNRLKQIVNRHKFNYRGNLFAIANRERIEIKADELVNAKSITSDRVLSPREGERKRKEDERVSFSLRLTLFPAHARALSDRPGDDYVRGHAPRNVPADFLISEIRSAAKRALNAHRPRFLD